MKLGPSRSKERIRQCREAAMAVLRGKEPMLVDDIRIAMRKHIRDITMAEAAQTIVYLCVEQRVKRHPVPNKQSSYSLIEEAPHAVV